MKPHWISMLSRPAVPANTPNWRPKPAVAPIEKASVPSDATATPRRTAAQTTSTRAPANNGRRDSAPANDSAAANQMSEESAQIITSVGERDRRRYPDGLRNASNGTTSTTPASVFAHQRSA